MQNKEFDFCVFIGRFQPFHLNHQTITQFVLDKSKHVIILLGSANRPRTIANPFTVSERVAMIFDSMNVDHKRLIFKGINDYLYNDQKWALEVQITVDKLIEGMGFDPDSVKIAITGNKGDESSYYIDLFPQWKYIEPQGLDEKVKHIHSTDIRSHIFNDDIIDSSKYIKEFLPTATFNFIENFKHTNTFTHLAIEYGFINDYKKAWAKAPYPPTFVTVDGIVIQSGHILLVKRRAAPGKGLWAIPGGFLDQNELIEDAVIRELVEETKIKVPKPVLKGCIKQRKVFDNPRRSQRGRTITHAFLIELPNGQLPRVKGADDAEKAIWLPISELKSEDMFEDHYDIISDLLGI